MKIDIRVSDKAYAWALAVALANRLKADVVIDADPEFGADLVLCDDGCQMCDEVAVMAVSKFEPVTQLVGRIRSEMLKREDILPVNTETIAVTGRGGSGVSTVSEILADLLSELFGEKVLLLSFGATGGPTERQIYDLLIHGTIDMSGLSTDDHGVMKLEASQINAGPSSEHEGFRSVKAEDRIAEDNFFGSAGQINPLGKLSRSEASLLLSNLGKIPGWDVIVLDVPLASPHLSLCVQAAENVVLVGNVGDDEIMEILQNETRGLNRILRFENPMEEGIPDLFSETGAALKRFVQEGLCWKQGKTGEP